jgi:hypothetical protein
MNRGVQTNGKWDRPTFGLTIVSNGYPEKGLSETPLAESVLLCRGLGSSYWLLNILHLPAETDITSWTGTQSGSIP